MESLLNTFGPAAMLGVLMLLALPLAGFGWVLRRNGRRGLARLARLEGGRARIGDVRAGAVTLVGKWKTIAPGRGLLEDAQGRAVMVEHDGSAPETAEGFLVCGTAIGEIDDPRAIDFRTTARLWRVEARGRFALVGDEKTLLGTAERAARRGAGIGAMLFTAGVALAMASVVLAARAWFQDLDRLD
jgi:hypothetical protein